MSLKTTLSHLVSSLVVLAFWVDGTPAQPSPPQPQEPDYRGYVERCLPVPPAFQPLPGAEYSFDHAAAAAVYTYLWKWTGRQEYAVSSLHLVQALATHWNPNDDFFTLYPFLVAFQGTKDAGLVDESLRQQVFNLVLAKYRPQQRGNYNQTACRISGVALALKVFPDLPTAPRWEKYVSGGWDDWYSLRDTPENSPNYNRIFWERMFHVAELTGRDQLLRDPAVHHVFERYRDQVSPGGYLPGFGDSPPWFHDPLWVAVFERAARLYRDPTLRWAALRMLNLPEPNPDTFTAHGGDYPAIASLLPLCYADEWRDRSLKPVVPPTNASLLVRRRPGHKLASDQIVLAPSRQPGAPYAMVELFGLLGTHAHPESGAVQFYEVNGVPLLQGPGYNNRSADHANIMLVRPANVPFPHSETLFQPNVWYRASISLKQLWPMAHPPPPDGHTGALLELINPLPQINDANLRHFDSFTFRVENGGRFTNTARTVPDINFWVDNLRLSGPGGEKRLDDFEKEPQKRWRGGESSGPSSDARQGLSSLKVTAGKGVTLINRKMDVTWDVRKFTHLEFDWKLSSNSNALSRPLLVRLGDRGRSLDLHAVELDLNPTVKEASAISKDGDSYGEATLTEYFTEDTTLRRQLVLTREGILIVRDTVLPGKKADGMVAGPIWHLPSKPTQGPNWFDANWISAEGKRVSLLICMGSGTERACGFQQLRLSEEFGSYTVFAKEPLKAGQAAIFVTVFAPHDPTVESETVAKRIITRTTPDATDVELPGAPGTFTVKIGNDSSWTVLRD